MAISKHDQIVQHIQSLEVGSKISVRKISQEMQVSEGTAYRAIKQAEKQDLVHTMPRVGTIRIEKLEKKNLEQLTFGEIANIVDGNVISGRDGLHKKLNKFGIGAMTLDAMAEHISEGDLLIVGNREEAYSLALEINCAILITGGFTCSDEIKRISNEKGLPIISSPYNSFAVATMINKAVSERLIKKKILLVEDILIENPKVICRDQKVKDYKNLMNSTTHERFPVIDDQGWVVGIITPKDIVSAQDEQLVERYMTKDPIIASTKTTVAYVAHSMIWQGIDMVPVVENKTLKGLITRRDVMKAVQQMRNQPQLVDTLEDMLIEKFEVTKKKNTIVYSGKVNTFMLSQLGVASWGSLNMLMTIVGTAVIAKEKNVDIVMDNFTSYFVKTVQIDYEIDVTASILDMGRSFSKVEIVVLHKEEIVVKGMLTARIIDK